MNAIDSLKFFYPELWLLGGAFALIFFDFFIANKKILGLLALGVIGAAVYCAKVSAVSPALFFGAFQLDTFTHLFRYFALGIVAITLLISLAYRPLKQYEGEYYALFLLMAFALTLMAAVTHLMMIFLAIEFVSILSYLLVGYLKHDMRSKEAAIKYLLFGSIASGLMLYGMSLLFGASGSLDLAVIQKKLAHPEFLPLTIVASLLFLAGVGFKISMAPFHLWAPDVYEGAPTSVTAFLTVGPKAMGFAVLLRIMTMIDPWLGHQWNGLIIVLSILTMTIGNITAITQNNIKRLLAYSSIAQAGYILMGIAVANQTGVTAVAVYLLAYIFTNLGAFTIVIIISNHFASDDLQSYEGLARRAPFLAASLTIFLLSLAGIPPLAGFIGKFLVFAAVIEAGYITLAVAAALNSAVAAYYYFRIIRVMYLTPAKEAAPIPNAIPLFAALLILLAGTILIGIVPAPFIEAVKNLILI